jgi:LysM repeat protein
MSEGGQLPWKRQPIVVRGPTADYSRLRTPIPDPPGGWKWLREGHDLKLVEEKEQDSNAQTSGESCVGSRYLRIKQATQSPVTPEAVEHVDYLVHTVLPSDTLAGICLRYKVSAMQLRRVNRFSGSNLSLAPAKLVIPLTDKVTQIQLQDRSSPEYKMQAMLIEFPCLRESERKAYLQLNDWDLEAAKRNARDDICWEQARKVRDEVLQKKSTQPIMEIHTGIPLQSKSFIHKRTYCDSSSPSNELLEPLLMTELEMARRR